MSAPLPLVFVYKQAKVQNKSLAFILFITINEKNKQHSSILGLCSYHGCCQVAMDLRVWLKLTIFLSEYPLVLWNKKIKVTWKIKITYRLSLFFTSNNIGCHVTIFFILRTDKCPLAYSGCTVFIKVNWVSVPGSFVLLNKVLHVINPNTCN
jgi:hypothetical protein